MRVLYELNRYLLTYSIQNMTFAWLFWLPLILQLTAFFMTLTYYMRRERLLHIFIISLAPVTLYFYQLLLYAPAMNALITGRFIYVDAVRRILDEPFYVIVTFCSAFFYSLAVFLEKKLFDTLHGEIERGILPVKVLDILLGGGMTGYTVYYYAALRDSHSIWFHSLYLYCVINLFIQFLVKYVLLMIGLLTGERRRNEVPARDALDVAKCKRKIKSFLAVSYRSMALASGAFAVTLSIPFFTEFCRKFLWNIKSVLLALLILIPLLFLWILTLYNTYRWIFIGSQKAWKVIGSWGAEESIFKLLYTELFDEHRPPKKTNQMWRTEHFLVLPANLCRRIYYLPLYERSEQKKKKKIYYFKDGSSFRLAAGNTYLFQLDRLLNGEEKSVS